MSDGTKTFNKDYDWDYDPALYVKDNYANLILEDHRLSYVTVCALRSRARTISSPFKTALHIGIGAVPRGSALIAPFMDSKINGAKITMGDIGLKKIIATRKLMSELRRGKLGIWQAHEDDMKAIDPLWNGAFQKAGSLSRVIELDITNLKEDVYDIATAEHVFESATRDQDEYKEYMRRYLRCVKRGGIVHLAYIVGSEGYTADGIEYPAYPVTSDEVLRCAQEELIDIENYFTSASGQMREEGDSHNYSGMGVLIGVRR